MSIQILTKGCLEKVQRIASGTYGIVYEAKDPKNENTVVAVKRMKIERHVDFVRCVKELDFLIRLKGHPYILSILAISKGSPFIGVGSNSPLRGDDSTYMDDKIYIIAEKSATNISTIIGQVSPEYIKMIMIQCLLAMEHMHMNNIIHRDIKPHNILWFRQGADRYVKFCDFGMSKVLTHQETNSCQVFTALYRAPEVITGNSFYSTKADMWSLGCIFFELVAKRSYITMDDYEPTIKSNRELFRKIIASSTDPFTHDLQLRMGVASEFKIESGVHLPVNNWDNLLKMDTNYINSFNRLGTHGKYEEYKDLLTQMLRLDEHKRYNATQALDHIFFKDHAHEILECRKRYPAIDLEKSNPTIKIFKCQERDWAMEVAMTYFNSQFTKKYDWYHDRIIFHAIRIFDKFINDHYQNGLNIKTPMNKSTAKFCFIVCVYLCIKYFLTLLEPCSFKTLLAESFRDEEHMKIAEETEWYILTHVIEFKIYEPSLFEAADNFNARLDKTHMYWILKSYCNAETTNMKLLDFFKNITTSHGIIMPGFPQEVKSVTSDLSQLSLSQLEITPPGTPGTPVAAPRYNHTSISREIGHEITNSKIPVGLQTVHGPRKVFTMDPKLVVPQELILENL